MERRRRAGGRIELVTLGSGVSFFHDAGPLVAGAELTLDEGVAHHARVRRLQAGDAVVLVDGRGARADATIERLGKRDLVVRVGGVERVAPLAPVHLLVPIADRERTLWLAEKAAELALASWRPVVYRRSRSVSPRGEGPAFAQKVRSRMAAALEQSGGAWLPEIVPEATLDAALAALPAGDHLLLDPHGEPMLARPLSAPATLAVGPEGGFEPEERETLLARGFHPVRLPGNILRFETAAVAALAITRAALTR